MANTDWSAKQGGGQTSYDQGEGQANGQPGRQRTRTWIMIAGLLGLLNVVQFYLYYDQGKGLEQSQKVVEVRSQELDQATSSLDSLGRELQERLSEVKRLGGDTLALAGAKRELMADLGKARKLRSADKRKIADLRERVEAYTYLLNEKDEAISKLKSERDQLFTYNRELKTNIVKQKDSLATLSSKGTELASKVALASILRAEGLRVTYLDQRGGERDDDVIRAKRLDKVKLTFHIGENRVAMAGAKDVYLVVLSPSAHIMPEPSGNRPTFLTAEGQELPYSMRQTFIFDNQQPRLTFLYGKGGEYEPGTYRTEVWCESYKIGESSFIIK